MTKLKPILQQKETKTLPTKPSGAVHLGGKKVKVSQETVKKEEGLSSKSVLKSLREASGTSIFSTPALKI